MFVDWVFIARNGSSLHWHSFFWRKPTPCSCAVWRTMDELIFIQQPSSTPMWSVWPFIDRKISRNTFLSSLPELPLLSFSFQPGDYVTINLPRVALYEFHPFTISSAPEEADYIRLHIQAVGNWTKQVYQRFKEMSESANAAQYVQVHRADQSERNLPKTGKSHVHDIGGCIDNQNNGSVMSKSQGKERKREPIVINGPYSSCARYVFDCKHVVLIGGGIGITPYASILSSLMAQFRASRTVCKHCDGINYNSKSLMQNRRLRKVDFIWVNRDQKNFEWFLNLLRQFEQEQEYYLASNEQEKRFLDIHLYFTEIKHDGNMGGVPLAFMAEVCAQIAGHDIFTSLKTKTLMGRPNWNSLFNQLISGENASTANDVNVFFCGPSTMGQAIKGHCGSFGFRFYEEKFWHLLFTLCCDRIKTSSIRVKRISVHYLNAELSGREARNLLDGMRLILFWKVPVECTFFVVVS